MRGERPRRPPASGCRRVARYRRYRKSCRREEYRKYRGERGDGRLLHYVVDADVGDASGESARKKTTRGVTENTVQERKKGRKGGKEGPPCSRITINTPGRSPASCTRVSSAPALANARVNPVFQVLFHPPPPFALPSPPSRGRPSRPTSFT